MMEALYGHFGLVGPGSDNLQIDLESDLTRLNSDEQFGNFTTAEMMYAFYMYTVDDEKLKVKDPGA